MRGDRGHVVQSLPGAFVAERELLGGRPFGRHAGSVVAGPTPSPAATYHNHDTPLHQRS